MLRDVETLIAGSDGLVVRITGGDPSLKVGAIAGAEGTEGHVVHRVPVVPTSVGRFFRVRSSPTGVVP